MHKSTLNEDFDTASSSEENFLLNNLKQLADRLRQKYNYSSEEIVSLIEKEEILVPVEIFSLNLAPAESLTKYLKETYDKNFHEISLLIKRNEKSLWQNYKRAVKKMPGVISVNSKIKVPISCFAFEKLSIFECLVYHLKEKKQMKNVAISKLLGKHPANIWSVYKRAVDKLR